MQVLALIPLASAGVVWVGPPSLPTAIFLTFPPCIWDSFQLDTVLIGPYADSGIPVKVSAELNPIKSRQDPLVMRAPTIRPTILKARFYT